MPSGRLRGRALAPAPAGGGAVLWPPSLLSAPPAPEPAPTQRELHAAALKTWRGDEVVEEAPEAPKAVDEPKVDRAREARLAAKYKRRDDASAAIGRKLLMGWTLLDATCSRPGCAGVPLMKDAAGRRYCVGCETFEGEAAAAAPDSPVLVDKASSSAASCSIAVAAS